MRVGVQIAFPGHPALNIRIRDINRSKHLIAAIGRIIPNNAIREVSAKIGLSIHMNTAARSLRRAVSIN